MILVKSISKAFGCPALFRAALSWSHHAPLRPDCIPEGSECPDGAPEAGEKGCPPPGSILCSGSLFAARHLG